MKRAPHHESFIKKALKKGGLALGVLVGGSQAMAHAEHTSKPLTKNPERRDPAHDAAAANYLEQRIRQRQEEGDSDASSAQAINKEV